MKEVVYIGKIINIESIVGADSIELTTVICGTGGRWKGITTKGKMSLGQKVLVYLQDALLPPSDVYPFMEKYGWRVRILKMRGCPSECLILETDIDLPVGTPVTEMVGASKFEKPIKDMSIAGPFPYFIPKTDEPNFQTAGDMVNELYGKPYVVTLKMDGTSCTAYMLNGELHVCSRNYEIKDTGNDYWKIAKSFNLLEGYAVQFEVYGEGWNGNPTGIKGIKGEVFNVYDIAARKYLGAFEAYNFCVSMKIPFVQFIETGDCFDYDEAGLRELSEQKYKSGKDAEGVVIRPQQEMELNGQRLSFKVINGKYGK